MGDCCSELKGLLNDLANKQGKDYGPDISALYARLANLEARVNSLSFNNSQNNSNSVNTAQIAQQAAGMVLAAPPMLGMFNMFNSLGPNPGDAVLGGKQGADLARQAAARSEDLSKYMANVDRKVGDVLGRLGKAEGLLARMMPLLTLVNLVGTIAALAEAYAANEIQGWRNDMNEKYADALSQAISKIYTVITPIKSQVERLGGELLGVKSTLGGLDKSVISLQTSVADARKVGNDGLYTANRARELVGEMAPVLEKAVKQANDALYSGNRANEKIVGLASKVTSVEDTLVTTKKQANDALYSGNRANEKLADLKAEVMERLVNAETVAGAAKKQANDALYSGNQANEKIQAISQNVSNLNNQSLTPAINVTFQQVQQQQQQQVAQTQQVVRVISQQQNQSTQTQQLVNRVQNQTNQINGQLDQLWGQIISQQQQLIEVQQKQSQAGQTQTPTASRNNQLETYYGQIQDLQQKVSQQQQQLNNTASSIQTSITNGVLTANTGLSAQIQNQISQLQSQITQLKIQTPQTNTDTFNKQVQNQVDQLQNQITALKVNTLTPQDIAQIKQQINNPPTTNSVKQADVDDMKATLKKIYDNQGLIPGLIIPAIAATPMQVGNFTGPAQTQIENAATTGVCRSTQPGGCMRRAIDPIEQGVNRSNNLLDKINAALSGFNTALLTGMNNTLNTVNSKLGNALPGGLSGFISKAWDVLQMDRVINILTLYTALHNATMLSSDILQTLVTSAEQLLKVVGIKDEKDQPIQIGEVFGKTIESLLKQLLGAAEYEELKTRYNTFNRIYQAGTNILNSITNIFYSLQNSINVIGKYVAIIGNALRNWGVVADTAYEVMSERFAMAGRLGQLESVMNGLQQASQVATDFSTITGEMVSVKQNVEELTKNKKEFEDTMSGKVAEQTTKEETENTASLSASVSIDDLVKVEEDEDVSI